MEIRAAIPRAAVLSDQQGDYVFVVNEDNNKAEQRRIKFGQSTPRTVGFDRSIDLDWIIVQVLCPYNGRPNNEGCASSHHGAHFVI